MTFVYTEISLSVMNPANFSLTIRSKGSLLKIFQKCNFTTEDKDIFRHFSVWGSPREFVQGAVNLIVPQRDMMLKRPRGTILLTDVPMSWVRWKRPSIDLNGSHLVCLQSGVLTNVHKQIAFLDLLCDLAELAEAMGSLVLDPADQSKSRGQSRRDAVKPHHHTK